MTISALSHEPDGLEKVWKMSASVPNAVHDCVHNLVARTVTNQPGAPAVCAWDGELTYDKLNELAIKLAGQLVNLKIGPGDIVPLCFEKSLWTAVAVLGVVKTGAGFVILDRFLPEERLRAIVEQTRAKLILSSVLQRDLASRLSQENTVISVGPSLAADVDGPVLSPNHPAPHPSSIVYVVFTSGSTGIPKGCVISHENLCSALHHQIPCLGYEPTSRVFDFASYSFDITIHNLFATWVTGGCVCIPNDAERKENLAKAMTRMKATLVHLTPTVARLLDPNAVPTLETLILVGEMVTEYDSKTWWGKTRQLINAYGPTECTSYSTLNYRSSTPDMLGSIGVAKGAVTWVVDPQNHDTLLPWGQTGELLVEGPIVGLGYLNDGEKTAAAFIEAPSWLLQGAFGVQGRRGRLYKTGDLARYDEEGNIMIIGRKDTQVKIRGNRIELGEVECRVHDCMPEVTRVVAEAVVPKGSTGHVLASFLHIPTTNSTESLGARLFSISKDVEAELAQHLPLYMIPTLFFTVPELPLTLTGKVDRKLLREMVASMSVEELAQQMAIPGEKRIPRTDAERGLRDLWAQVLNIGKDSIGIDDSFFRLGGDSMLAMKLVGEGRKIGIGLTLADIFQQPVLGELSKLMSRARMDELFDETPLGTSLLDADVSDGLISHIESSSIIPADDIAEILPLTDMQENFILDGFSENRHFVDYYYLDLGPRVNLTRLKESCRELLEAFPIIRATFVHYKGKHWAAIPKHLDLPFHLTDVESDLQDALADFCLHDIASFKRNQPIILFTLLRHERQGVRLIMRLSHAQYDAISIGVIFKALIGSYHGQKTPRRFTFSTYLAHLVRQRPTSMSYFKNLLKGAKYTDMKSHFLPNQIPSTIPIPYRIENEILSPKIPPDITPASFMSAAWGLFLSQLLNQDEVIYGRLLNGRNASVPGIEELVGCCINVVPVRVTPSRFSAKQLVQSVQAQFGALAEADSFGFEEVIQNCTDWPTGARIYSCTMHQNVDEDLAFEMDGWFIGQLRRFENDRRLPFFMYMISFPRGERLGVQIYAHSHMLSVERATELLEGFCPVVERLAAALEEKN